MRYGIGFLCSAVLSSSMLFACSGIDSVSIPRAESSDPSPMPPAGGKAHDAGATRDSSDSNSGDGSVVSIDAGTTSSGIDASFADAAPAPPVMPTLDQVLAITAKCAIASNGGFAPHEGQPAYVDICRLNGAFFWTSEMRIDCDGQASATCKNGPYFSNETALHQSDGQPLDAASLPYVVIPDPNAVFDFAKEGIALGDVVLVVYGGKMAFGIVGDTGPSGILGSASYAKAQSLGINPDPFKGGTGGGVTYIAFTGPGTVPAVVEDHSATVTLGTSLASQLVASNQATSP